MVKLFDSHTHINNEDYTPEEREALIKDIENSDLAYVMDVGCDLPTSRMAVEHAHRYPWCYGVVGIHPHDAKNMTEDALDEIEKMAHEDKIMAIGEIGLDFHYDISPRDEQRECFRRQIRLANKLKMPIVIHTREADGETLDILVEEGAFSEERKSWFPLKKDGTKDARVLLHCYSGSKELAEEYVKSGATISISGTLTYKNNKKTPKVVEAISIDNLLIETDAPYLTPEPFRGRPNKAPYVEHTARRMALIKGMEYEEVARITLENAKRFFGIED